MDISVENDTVKLGLGSVKNANKPKKNNTRYTLKKNARRAIAAVGKQVASFRPDLKVRCTYSLACKTICCSCRGAGGCGGGR